MELDWRRECSTVKERDAKLLETEIFYDCKFEIGEEKQVFYGHKLYFLMASPVFEQMFSKKSDVHKDIESVILKNIQPNAFALLIKYIYIDEIDFKSLKDAADLIDAAQKCRLFNLIKRCIGYLIENLNPLTALEIYEYGKLRNEKQLIDAAFKVICEQTKSVLDSPNFKCIDLTLLEVILEQEKLGATEDKLFESLETLAKSRGLLETPRGQPPIENKELLTKFQELAKKINYLSLNGEDFANGPCFSKLLLVEDKLPILACITIKDLIDERYPVGFNKNKRRVDKPPRPPLTSRERYIKELTRSATYPRRRDP